MLPDFPELKKQIRQLLTRRMRHTFRGEAALLSQIRKFQAHEGDTFTIERPDGTREKSAYRRVEARMTIPKKDLPTLTPQELIRRLDETATKMAMKTSKGVVQRLRESIPERNVVRGAGRPLSFELLIQVLEKIALDFHPDGRPHELTALVGPEAREKLHSIMKEMESNPEMLRRYQAVVARKREEWRVRESCRKLVD